MYSQKIILQQASKIERATGRDLVQYPVKDSLEMIAHINTLYDEEGNFTRGLTAEEEAFIHNELLLSKIDFRHWLLRYCHIQIDDNIGGVRVVDKIWGSQEILLRKMAELEEAMWEAFRAGHTRFDAICIFIHKARQLGFTMICQAILAHMLTFYAGFRGLTASVEDDKTQDVHIRFTTIMDNLPRWMMPDVKGRTKDKGFLVNHDGEVSKMMLQDSMQKKGLGQGEQWDGVHFTEVASWMGAKETIQNHFFPTVSEQLKTRAFMESTAQGMGNWWHKATEQARQNKLDRWHYVFVPWYAEYDKYHAYPPDDWSPASSTITHANFVRETSFEFMGHNYELSRGQMYWYERKYQSAVEDHALQYFLANFCATPEESFQHSGDSIFDAEIIMDLTQYEKRPAAYELLTPALSSDHIIQTDQEWPKPLKHKDTVLVPIKPDVVNMEDPRGLILLWEPPSRDNRFFMGADAAGGIPGWNRNLIIGDGKKDNEEKDNAALQIFRPGRDSDADVQVGEFAAPIPPDAFTPLIAALSHIYRGKDDEHCMINVESYPTPDGAIVQRDLIHKHQMANFMPWITFESGRIKETGKWGFQSTNQTVPQLWVYGKQHVHGKSVMVRSKYLRMEMSYCKYDPVKNRGMAMSGWHDDRVTAFLLCMWLMHNWAIPDDSALPDDEEEQVLIPRGVDPRDLDISYDDLMEYYDNWLYD